MAQSSLMTWLNKPQSVTQKPAATSQPQSFEESQPELLPTQPHFAQGNISLDAKEATPFISGLKPLPENVELRACTKDDIPHLKRLLSLLLPIPYPDKFYNEIVQDKLTSDISLLAVWHDDPAMAGQEKGRLVGAIRCRLFAHPLVQPKPDGKPMLYLSTLALLSPYRQHGIATHMLHLLTKRAVDNYGITSVGAHVWEANADGLEWYRKRGFHEVSRQSGYYPRLVPPGAVVLQRNVSVMDSIKG